MAKYRICLDTDIIIDFLRGKSPGQEILEKCINLNTCYITFITAFEIYLGMGSERQKQIFDGLLEELKFIPSYLKTAETSAQIIRELRKGNKEIGFMDSIIAGTCINNNLVLVTKNIKHFNRIKGLKLFPI